MAEYLNSDSTFEQFFSGANLNPNASLITGVICGYRIEDIENPLTRKVRYLDKLVDELAKGRKMEKILRLSVESLLKFARTSVGAPECLLLEPFRQKV